MTVDTGDAAPPFTLETADGPIALSDYAGRTLVLYFYPKDDTSGCTAQAIAFSGARAAFEQVPWVRRAVVQREFPNRLKVVLQEHNAVAYWGPEEDVRLVNDFGEVFEVNQGDAQAEGLPLLGGPQGQALLVLQTYQALLPMFKEMGAVLEQLQLTGQGNWHAQLDSGATIELGHGSTQDITARTRRFIATLKQVSARFERNLESADLRYGNGYAIKLRGVTTLDPGDQNDAKKKR